MKHGQELTNFNGVNMSRKTSLFSLKIWLFQGIEREMSTTTLWLFKMVSLGHPNIFKSDLRFPPVTCPSCPAC